MARRARRKSPVVIRPHGRPIAARRSAVTEPSRRLHVVLQGRSGVGKTVVTLLLLQCIEEAGRPVRPVDAGSGDASLSALATAPPEPLSIPLGDMPGTRALDGLVATLTSRACDVVLDTGAAAFVPLGRYLVECDAAARIMRTSCQLTVHVVVTGGPAMADTMQGLATVARHDRPDIRIVVWVNEFFGPLVGANGEAFEDLPAYTGNRERIFALVRLAIPSAPAGADLQAMFAARQTFARALAPGNTGVHRVQKSRLFRVRHALWPQIARVL